MRQNLADILKGLAVIFMIQVHVTELLMTPQFQKSMAGVWSMFFGGPPAAPLFLIIMGYFFAASKKNAKSKYLRGLKLIAIGLLLNLSLNASILFRIYKGEIHLNPLQYIFGVDVLFVAGLSVIMLTVLEKYLRVSIFIPLLIGLIVIQAGSMINLLPINENSSLRYIWAFFGGAYKWSYFPLFPWMAYVLTGFTVYLILQKFPLAKLQNSTGYILTLVLLVFIVITLPFGLSTAANLSEYYHHGIPYYLWTTGFLAFFALIVYFAQKTGRGSKVQLYLEWIGRNVTEFYIIQWLIIGNTATWIFKTQTDALFPVWLIFLLLITSGIAWIWEKKLKKLFVSLSDYLIRGA